MKLRCTTILLGLGLLLSNSLLGQSCASTSSLPWEWPSHSNWFYGSGQKATFSGGSATYGSMAGASLSTYEGTITASDDAGNLLFYGNGYKVANAAGTTTYTGIDLGLGGTTSNSACQGIILVRHPLDPNTYHIFSTDDALDGNAHGMNHYTFDANGNRLSGPTRLTTETGGTFYTTEGISATMHSNGVDVWIVTQAKGARQLNAFLLECTGLSNGTNAEKTSDNVGPNVPTGARSRGGIKFSPDGSHLAQAYPFYWESDANKHTTAGVSICDFNTTTGAFTNGLYVNNTNNGQYDVEFSPDGNRIYVSCSSGAIKTFDISSGNAATIMASVSTISGTGSGYGNLEIGGDGALYYNRSSLIKISGNLNSASGLSVSTASSSGTLGLPNMLLPPQEEPDITEVGPFCTTDAAVDLSTNWLCSGLNAEDASNTTAYSGTGITDATWGTFDPATAGAGVHEIIFKKCNVDDTIWITVNQCTSCEAEIQDVTPEICVGETHGLDQYVTKNSSNPTAGVWTIGTAPGGTSATISISGTDTSFNASNTATADGTYKVYYTVTDGAETCRDSINVTVNPLPTISITSFGPLCIDASAVTLAATPTGGSFEINGSAATSFDPATLGAGTHKVKYTYTDGNGCTNADSINVDVNALPTPSVTSFGPLCIDAAAVTLAATPTGGSFEINGSAATSFDPATLGAGTHKVKYTYTDGNGCTNADSINVDVNALPTPSVTSFGPLCIDAAAVTLAGTPTGGSFEINGSAATSFDPATLGAGTHKVKYTYTDGNGCSGADSINVDVNALPTPAVTSFGPLCIDAAAVTLAGTPTGGSFEINGSAATSFDPATLGAGTHKVKYSYTDGNGCANADSINVDVNALPTPAVTSFGPLCIDAAAVTLAGTPTGGSFEINGSAATSFDPATLGAGTHKVKYSYTDGNGCSNADSINVDVNALPTISITSFGPLCIDVAAVTLAATPTGGSFEINGSAATSFDPAALGAGTHKVKYSYTDGNGCANADSINVDVNALPTPSVTSFGPLCEDAAVVTLAGTPTGGSFEVNGSAATNFDPAVLGAGTHKVKYLYTDGNGCSSADSINVDVNALPTPSVTSFGPLCIDAAAVTLAGTPTGGSFEINGSAATSFDPATLGAGTHKVKYSYTDGNGCSSADSINVDVNALPTINITSFGPLCIDAAAVTLAGTPTGGSFEINGSAATSFDPATLGAGTHKVKYSYTDGNGCANADSINVDVNALPTPAVTSFGPLCIDAAAVTLAGTPTGGSFEINGSAATSFDPSTLSAGTHKVKYSYTDGNGCSNADSINVDVNALPTISITSFGPLCIDAAAVTLAATPTGGNFEINGSAATSFDPATLGAGTHKVKYTYTDGNGCTNADSINVDVNALPTPSVTSFGPLCIDAAAVTLAGTPTGGSFEINGSAATSFDPATLGAGTHKVKYSYTDGNGCANADSINVDVNALPTPSVTSFGPLCEDAAAVTLAGTPTGGSFEINGSAATSFDPSTLGAGTHKVKYTYTDGNGCSGADSINVDVNALPTPAVTSFGPLCVDAAAVTLAGTPTGGSFEINGSAATSFDPATLGAGTHKVKYSYTDGNGCSSADSIDVTVNALPTVNLGPDQTICADGSSVTFDAGTFASYTWNDASTGQTLSTSTAGDYFVKVTDANGCSDSDSVALVVNALPTISLGNDTAICAGDAAVTFDAGTYTSYAWSDGSNGQTLTTANAGTYKLVVTNANGCSDSDEVVLTVNALPTIDLGPDQDYCEGGNAVTFDAGIHTSYLWNDATTGQTLTASVTGEYSVEVTDANGCKNRDTVNLTVNTLPAVSLGPDVTICPGSSVTLDAGTGMSTYAWSDGSNGQTVAVTDANPGEFIVTVTDANGCTAKDTANVTVAAQLSVDMGPDQSICQGDTVTLDAGNISGATYAWSPNSSNNTQVVKVTTSGQYVVVVTDAMGCSGTDTVNVTVNTNPTLDLGPDQVTCPGGTAVFDAGYTWASVTWNDGTTANSLVTNTAGKYYCNVIDVNGCTANDTAEFSFHAAANVDLGIDKTICPGTSASFDAGNFASYAWHDGSNGQTYSTSSAETVWVDVTDVNGCTDRDSAIVTVRANLAIDLGPDRSACQGSVITLDPNLDNTYTLTWGDGSSADTLNVSTSGEYVLNVVDANGCDGTDTVNISINANPTLDVADQNACPGDNVTFDAGNSWATVTWSDGSNSNTINVTNPGTYYVDVVDANGCTTNDTMRFAYHVVTPVDLGADRTVCPGSSANFDAGTYASYEWQNGGTGSTYSTVTAEDVWVRVTDVNGCSDTDSAVVVVRAQLLVDLGPDQSACQGSVITLDPGFDNTFSLTWSDGSTADTLNVTSTGEYRVDVVDANGCTGADTINVTINANPTLDVADQNACPGDNVTFDAGNTWATVTWSDGSTANTLTATAPGKYYVDVVDANGCTTSDTMTFAYHTVTPVNLGPDQTVCPGSNANFNAGTYSSYVWQDASTASTFTTTKAGDVWVRVTDANGCSDTDSAVVSVRAQLQVDLGPDQTVCEGTAVTLTTPFDNTYDLTWSDGSKGATMTVTSSGKYYLDVVDANGCSGVDTVEVTINANPVIDLGNDFSLCDGEDSTLSVGNFPTVLWTGGQMGGAISVSALTITSAGTYNVQVTDANGCSASDQVTITFNSNPQPDLGPDQQLCPGQDATFQTTTSYSAYEWQDASTASTFVTKFAGQVRVEVMDANGCKGRDTAEFTHLPALQVDLGNDTAVCEGQSVTISTSFDPNSHTFRWGELSKGDLGTNATFTATETGTYYVYVSDGGGCAGYDEKVVTVNTNPVPNPGPDTSICAGESATLNAGFVGATSYSWSNGVSGENIIVSTAGSYIVTVVDANGCTGVGSVDLVVNALPIITPNPDQTACLNSTVTINPTLPAGTYIWSTGATTSSITTDSAGTYTVEVTDANGCKATDEIEVSFWSLPVFDLGDDISICDGLSTSFGETFAANGWSVAWNTGATSDSLKIDSNGIFIATAKDANGCTYMDTISVTILELPTPTSSPDTTVCFEEIGSMYINVDGVTARDQVMWSTNQSLEDIEIDSAGTYIVTLESMNGCTASDTTVISEKCVSKIFVPNTFTPGNLDNFNDVFLPKGINIRDYDLYIFNRWGEQIFHSNDINHGWDGTYKGRLVQIDVYVWKIYYRTEEDHGGYKRRQMVGHVTVLR